MQRRIGVLVYPGVTLMDVSGPAEVLSRAAGYEIVCFSPAGGTVATSSHIPIADTVKPSPIDASLLDTLIIAGADWLPAQPWPKGLLETVDLLVSNMEGKSRIASVCTGAFVLAELGLLDGRHATTHWQNTRELAMRYPQIKVDPDTLHVHDGRFITSAGITAGIDLALSLVEEDHGAATARAIAQDMVVFMHRPGGQSQFVGHDAPLSISNPIVRKAMETFKAEPHGDHSLTTLAEAVAVSSRHLGRLFRQELGMTPGRWMERMRLQTAQDMILEGHSITAAARHSGFGNDENLRRSFERRFRMSPTEYRARFRTTFR
ncbi:GlxA family transcriptional regulator [Corynebacterium sp. J010B-136]|uniref:GlxA family transcriptional regulator n=1 Tax=Corynebacterium sp. J010B-136 TaxID=2099401 RepID=UPI000CF985A3|nr:GlxA family transcriptional regulator [Corynebacterium sp. J010B-136]PQM75434.1 AraC family transcriptional regulator [Corynebacterium sp. J010B-136]